MAFFATAAAYPYIGYGFGVPTLAYAPAFGFGAYAGPAVLF